jgi:hypothetical protein
MLRDGWSGGTVHTRLRPLIVWLKRRCMLIRQPVMTFDAMNFVYAGVLAVALSMLLRRYGAGVFVRAVADRLHRADESFPPVHVLSGACRSWRLCGDDDRTAADSGRRAGPPRGQVAAVLARSTHRSCCASGSIAISVAVRRSPQPWRHMRPRRSSGWCCASW